MKVTAAFKDAVRVWKSVKASDEKLAQDVENEIKSEYPLEYAALQADGDKILEEETAEEVEVVEPKEEVEESCDKALEEVVSNAIVLARHNVSTIITKANDEFMMAEVADEQVDNKVDEVIDETKEEAVDDATELREELSGDEDEKKALEPQIVDNEEAIASIRAIHSSYNKNTSVTDLPNKKFYVTATDDAPTHVEIDQPIEEKAEETEMPKVEAEEEVKLLTEPEAQEAIAAFKKAGTPYITKKVSKTKFIVKAEELPVVEEPKVEAEEDDVKIMSEDEMKEAVASATKAGKKLIVTEISKTKFAVASDMEVEETPVEESEDDAIVEKPVEETEIILSAEELHDELEQASDEELLTEPEAEEAIAKLKAEGKNYTTLKASRTHYIVRAMDAGEEDTTVIDELKEEDADLDAPLTEEVVSEELPVEEKKDEETVESDEEEVKILSEDEMKETVAKFEKEGTKHKVIKASKNKYIVTSDEDMIDEEEQEACNEELAPVEANANYDLNGVYTVLCYDDTENPEYFVIANRKPIATISLSSLSKNSSSTKEIRAYFMSPKYTKNLVDLIDQNGLVKTLKQVNAKFFVNPAITQEELQASFVDQKNKEYADKAINVVDNLRDCFNLSLAAFDKGMYPQDNALKAALFKAFDPIVANGQAIEAAVDAGCQEGLLPMFDAVMEKSLAFLDYSEDSLNEIRAHVKGTTTTYASTIEKGNLKK